MEKKFDVLAVGNAIVDVIGKCDESFITQEKLVKGSMRLIDEAEANRLYGLMPKGKQVAGGSAANTIAGLADLGANVAFIGKVADDALGDTFRSSMKASGVHFETASLHGGPSTARCMILVTPDGQRTMNTYLGASVEFTDEDLDENLVAQAKIVYLEGYLFDKETAKKAFRIASQVANEAGAKVALTLSDLFCVDRHREEFKELIANHVDILFANHEELLSLYQTRDLDDAIAAISKDCSFAAITFSANGSMVIQNGRRDKVGIYSVDVVDTTGAGDLYSTGFLYGYTRGYDPVHCAQIGTLCAAEIVSHIGARAETDLRSFVNQGLKTFGVEDELVRICA